MKSQNSKLQLALVVGSLLFLLIGFLKGGDSKEYSSAEEPYLADEAMGAKLEQKPVVVIDAGHPATSLRTENKARTCVLIDYALY